jgi:hypothetical protein
MLVKSKGHVAFIGEYEYFVHEEDANLYMASSHNPIDTLGYRQGARWEALPSHAQGRITFLQTQYATYYL